MRKRRGATAYVFRLQLEQTSVFPAISKEAYSNFLRSLDGDTIKLSSPTELIITSDLMRFTQKVKRFLNKTKDRKFVLIFEVLQDRADVRTYDDVCDGIALALRGRKCPKPRCVVIVVPNVAIFRKSVLLERRLAEICRELELLRRVFEQCGAHELQWLLA